MFTVDLQISNVSRTGAAGNVPSFGKRKLVLKYECYLRQRPRILPPLTKLCRGWQTPAYRWKGTWAPTPSFQKDQALTC